MHQIRFRLGLDPLQTLLGSLHRSPDPLAGLRGLLLLRGGGKGEKGGDYGVGREGRGGEGKGG